MKRETLELDFCEASQPQVVRHLQHPLPPIRGGERVLAASATPSAPDYGGIAQHLRHPCDTLIHKVSHLDEIASLVARGALFVISHSAGKDSQAMALVVRHLVPADQILVVHAVLPEVEWDGVIEHIEATMSGLPLVLAHAAKTFFEMVDHRGMFPSPANRQCTSDLKRGPIEREVRRYLVANARYGGLVVMCMGMRAQESTGRAKLETFKLNAGNSKAGREWYDWLPIHAWTADQVFASIAQAGEVPHWAYAAGMSRLSCCFCIMSSEADLKTAARLNPELYERYAAKERELGFTLSMSRRTLPEIINSTTKQGDLL